jgi:hemoglobin
MEQLIDDILNAKVNWKKHLPMMYDFWENIIFLTNKYSGNPMIVHTHLNKLTPLTKEHFNRWINCLHKQLMNYLKGKKHRFQKKKRRVLQ